MKYVLMYTQPPRPGRRRSGGAPGGGLSASLPWFDEHGAVFVDGGAELLGPETATTVRSGENGEPVVVDGPFSEAKENIGGFSVIDVPDLDAALALVKTWPSLELPGIAVEIRPIGRGLPPT